MLQKDLIYPKNKSFKGNIITTWRSYTYINSSTYSCSSHSQCSYNNYKVFNYKFHYLSMYRSLSFWLINYTFSSVLVLVLTPSLAGLQYSKSLHCQIVHFYLTSSQFTHTVSAQHVSKLLSVPCYIRLVPLQLSD